MFLQIPWHAHRLLMLQDIALPNTDVQKWFSWPDELSTQWPFAQCCKSDSLLHACRTTRPDHMRPADGEATAPDFEKDLDKDPHEADIPDFEGLNVKNEVRMRLCGDPVPDSYPQICDCQQFPTGTFRALHGSQGAGTCQDSQARLEKPPSHLCASMRASSSGKTSHHR